MAYFHYRCGERITLINENCTAIRNNNDFDHGLVVTAEPLGNDVLFEIKIDRKVNTWSGSLEIGVTEVDPLHFDFLPCASRLQNGTWIMTGSSILKDGALLVERYGIDLDRLNEEDRVGVMRTSEGDLVFFINGESQGVAAEGLPLVLYAIVDLYGKCVQVTITNPILREHNNDDCLSGSSVLAIENDILNVTLGADLSELSLSSSTSLDIRMDLNVSLSLPEECPPPEKLKFHERCGSLIRFTNGRRTAERRRPLDEFNNGVIMTQRPLLDNELFEIRIDHLVDKWSGSIEMGITTHDPSMLVFPATMTNLHSGTIMMSGCGILINGVGIRREYGGINLDELRIGDRIAMMRKSNGNLHFYINGVDQGVACNRVPSLVWGVIDLYGMASKVTLVDRDEREVQNLMLRHNARSDEEFYSCIDDIDLLPESDYYNRLTFHVKCGAHAQVINNGKTALRPNAADDFNNGVVLTSRTLKVGEMFEVRLDRVITKWAGSIEIGVTTHSPTSLEFPFTMTNVRSGTWMMTGSGIMHNGVTVLEQYGVNLDRLQVGDRVGVVAKESGFLHFFVNGEDQGAAASNISEKVYGVIDLYGQAVEASIVDMYDYNSPDTLHSSLSNTTLYSEIRFHHVHGRNARVINNGLTAVRPRPLTEFNDAIVFTNRPLKDGELFEIILEKTVDRWSGSVEIGVTACRPDELELPSTATDLDQTTWMLSGSSIMENGKTIRNNYLFDLDTIETGIRIGVMRNAEKSLEFYRDGVPQGMACVVRHSVIYGVVDLYGQCSQVSIPCASPVAPLASIAVDSYLRSDTSVSLRATSVIHAPIETDLHRFHECHGKGVTLSEGGRVAVRGREIRHSVVFSSTPLIQDELFEVAILSLASHLSGTLCVGVTTILPTSSIINLSRDCCYITGNELRWKNKLIQHFSPSLSWLRVGDRIGIMKIHDGSIKVILNNEELHLNLSNVSEEQYVVLELRGSCLAMGVTSRKIPITPSTTAHMQDSLELNLEPDQKNDAVLELEPLESFRRCVHYEFHENHGRNIELVSERLVARRVASYNQGIVIVQPALEPGQMVKVLLEQLDLKWSSSIIVGVVCGLPERLTLPVSGLAFKNVCCIISNDWISINGVKSKSSYNKLNSLSPGTIIGIKLTESGFVQIFIDGVAEEPIQHFTSNGQPCFAIFDLYGQCQQIKILNDLEEEPTTSSSTVDYEKGDLELGEKERVEMHLSLPLAISTMTISQKSNPISPNKPCDYLQACEYYKKMLFLPDEFFLPDEPTCYCLNCCKLNEDVGKDDIPRGWVKFPLRNLNNLQTDKWHTAYYASKLGYIRNILDRGQPLTKGQEQYGSLVCQKGDDLQIGFYPSIQNCITESFKLDDVKDVHAAFQLLVKPGAYSISRDCLEWSTKESGALVLCFLLLRYQMQ